MQKSDPPKLLLTFQGTSQIQFSIIPIKDSFQSHVKERVWGYSAITEAHFLPP